MAEASRKESFLHATKDQRHRLVFAEIETKLLTARLRCAEGHLVNLRAQDPTDASEVRRVRAEQSALQRSLDWVRHEAAQLRKVLELGRAVCVERAPAGYGD